MSPSGGTAGRLESDLWWAGRTLRGGVAALESYTLQTKSHRTRDVFALAASADALAFDDLAHLAAPGPGGPVPELDSRVAGLDQQPFLALARVLGSQAADVGERELAVRLFLSASRVWGDEAFSPMDKLVLLEALAELGHADELDARLRAWGFTSGNLKQDTLLRANCLAALDPGHDAMPSQEWLELVNAMYRQAGLETIAFVPGDGPLMDRILCGPAEQFDDGPCVTVVVPTHESGERIGTTLRSLLSQTWQNLDILVVDDASSPANDHHIEAWVARDPRIRWHKFTDNRGTYRGRNHAVRHMSKGELVTVNDDDDWSHPRKIETQVRHLLANPDLVANVSLLARSTPSMRFVRINNLPIFAQVNFSSFMFWKDRVVERVGLWDEVNRGADSEFIRRVESVFGQSLNVAGDVVLSFPRVREGSLTSGELSRGYMDPRRLWYHHSALHWHDRVLAEGQTPRLGPVTDPHTRPFAVPRSMVGSRSAHRPVHVDVLYVAEFRFPPEELHSLLEELRRLRGRGCSVGLLEMASPLADGVGQIEAGVLEFADDPAVHVISLQDDVRAGLVVVRDPTVLHFAQSERSAVAAQRLVLVAGDALVEEPVIDLPRALRTAEAVFGAPARVAPQSATARLALRELVDPDQLTGQDWPQLLEELPQRPEEPPNHELRTQ